MRKDETACVKNLKMKVHNINVVPVRHVSGTHSIGYAIIHAFKGMEAEPSS
jgi:hypothetical protein